MSGNGISWVVCKSAPRSRQITMPAPHHSVFTGRMPFLLPNQQRQSTGSKGWQDSHEAIILLVCKNQCKNLLLLLPNLLGGLCGKNPIWQLSDTVNGHYFKRGVSTAQWLKWVKSCWAGYLWALSAHGLMDHLGVTAIFQNGRHEYETTGK